MKTTTPVSVSKIEIDFVNQTMTLWNFDEPVATYRPERTGFDIHIVAHVRAKDTITVPVRGLSYYDKLLKTS